MGKRRQNNSAKVIQLVGDRALAPGHGTLLPPRWLGLAFKGLKPIQIQQGGLTWLVRELPAGCRHRMETHIWVFASLALFKRKGSQLLYYQNYSYLYLYKYLLLDFCHISQSKVIRATPPEGRAGNETLTASCFIFCTNMDVFQVLAGHRPTWDMQDPEEPRRNFPSNSERQLLLLRFLLWGPSPTAVIFKCRLYFSLLGEGFWPHLLLGGLLPHSKGRQSLWHLGKLGAEWCLPHGGQADAELRFDWVNDENLLVPLSK